MSVDRGVWSVAGTTTLDREWGIVVSNTDWFSCLLCFSASNVHYCASISGFSIIACPFGIL